MSGRVVARAGKGEGSNPFLLVGGGRGGAAAERIIIYGITTITINTNNNNATRCATERKCGLGARRPGISYGAGDVGFIRTTALYGARAGDKNI